MDNLSPASQPHLRQSYTAAQKIRIVQESMRPDASIAAVAMSHRINANQLHRWRWMVSIRSEPSGFLPSCLPE